MSGAEALLVGAIISALWAVSLALAQAREGREVARQLERAGSGRRRKDGETDSGQ